VDEHAETPSPLHELQDFLYNQAHRGLLRAGNADPPSGFRLVADRVVALAELAYAPESSDVSTGRRYIRFVHEHFPDAYREHELGGLILMELYLTPPFLQSHATRLATIGSATPRSGHLSTDGDGRLISPLAGVSGPTTSQLVTGSGTVFSPRKRMLSVSKGCWLVERPFEHSENRTAMLPLHHRRPAKTLVQHRACCR
jgi:hypothetical protein